MFGKHKTSAQSPRGFVTGAKLTRLLGAPILATLMSVAGTVHAQEQDICGSAVQASVSFMTETYGGNAEDVLVQVVSAKKELKGLVVADVLTQAGEHQCALKLSPETLRRQTRSICQWSLQVVSCDSAEALKKVVVDEPFWAAEKSSRKASQVVIPTAWQSPRSGQELPTNSASLTLPEQQK
ncbi:hypothetical protein ACEN2T_17285 [Pseudomonas sp. W22_MBD1_FP4]|uniref:hypothetical protein n=1 Tax=Pseudomonas sp. W22_MBD1_FP4 TaxID=3240272 RepID=UPI003F96513A